MGLLPNLEPKAQSEIGNLLSARNNRQESTHLHISNDMFSEILEV